MLSGSHTEQKAENREMLQIILSCIHFLDRQGLSLRGHCKKDDMGMDDEFDSNLLQLLKTWGEDDPRIFKWMKKSKTIF